MKKNIINLIKRKINIDNFLKVIGLLSVILILFLLVSMIIKKVDIYLIIVCLSLLVLHSIIYIIFKRRQKYNNFKDIEPYQSEMYKVARIGSWIWDIHTDNLNISDEGLSFFDTGGVFLPVTIKQVTDKVVEADRDFVIKSLKSSVNTGKDLHFTCRINTRVGDISYININARANYDSNGNIQKLIGTIQDVSLLKKAEQELHIYKTHLEELVNNRTNELLIAKEHLIQEKLMSDTLVDSLPSLFFLINSKYEILKTNKHLEEVTGYDKDFLIGTNISDIIIDSENDKDVPLFLSDKKEHQVETRIKTSKGEFIPFLFTTSKLSYNGIEGYIGIGTDLTALRSAMEEISKLSQVVEQNHSSIIITDLNGRIEYANPSYKKQFGYSDADLYNSTLSEFDKSEENDILWETISSGNVWTGEFHKISKDGLEFWEYVKISPIKNKDGQNQSFLVIKDNISDIKKLEESVRISDDRYRILFEQAGDAIVLIDVDTGGLVDFNKEAYKNLDYYKNDFSMLSMEKLELTRDNTKSFSEHRELLLKNGSDTYETELLSYYGNIVNTWINSRIITIKDRRYIQSMWRDITDIKFLENQLILEKNRAESSSLVKSKFLANMSHEIRTPMNSIIGFIELSLESDNIDNNINNYLTTSLSSARNLLGIIDDILSISKLESGNLKIIKRSFNLHKLLKECMDIFLNLVDQKPVLLTININSTIPKCLIGDSTRLRQVLLNLVGNAIKFTNEGSIHIEVSYKNSDFIEFKIIDTGIGMTSPQLEQLFIPFSQADDSTVRKYGGTGLGTTISQNLVRLMGGDIRVSSKLGTGSTFSFTIPGVVADCIDNCDLNCEEYLNDEPKLITKNKKYYNILLAEDIEDNAVLVTTRLLKEGHALTKVNSGVEVVKEFKSGNFDLILMDVHMPGCSGIEATKEIRKLESFSSIPIIALTASVMVEEQNSCFSAGMDAVVSKPIQFRELFATMDEIVPDDKASSVPYKNTLNSKTNGIPSIPNNIPGIDYNNAMETWQNHSLYVKSLYSFIEKFEHVSTELQLLFNKKLYEELYEKVHAIKGVSGNLSLINIEQITVEMTKLLGNKSYENIDDLLSSLESEISIIKKSSKIIVEIEDSIVREPSKEKVVDLIDSIIESSKKGEVSEDKIQVIISYLESRIPQNLLNKIIKSNDIYEMDQIGILLTHVRDIL